MGSKSWIAKRVSLLVLGIFVLSLLKAKVGLTNEVMGPVVTDKVFFDIEIGGEKIGRIVVGLFGEILPKTVKNFKTLTEGTYEKDGYVYSYKGAIFHRIIKNFVVQGGDITRRDGTGGMSIYGGKFPDENFQLRHYGPGWLNMANSGPDTNTSQFCFMLTKAEWLDGKHMVFGKVLEGMDVVRRMEAVETNKERPVVEVSVSDCGSLPLDRHFAVSTDPVEG